MISCDTIRAWWWLARLLGHGRRLAGFVIFAVEMSIVDDGFSGQQWSIFLVRMT